MAKQDPPELAELLVDMESLRARIGLLERRVCGWDAEVLALHRDALVQGEADAAALPAWQEASNAINHRVRRIERRRLATAITADTAHGDAD